MSSLNPTAAIIQAEIARSGPIPFRRFMELALYEPAHGYYSSGLAEIGREGDFLTSVSVGPLFGRLLESQFAEMWRNLGRPSPFTLVEQGANTGDFARDVLEAARAEPEFFAALRYRIVEPFPVNLRRQRETLGPLDGKITWHESLDGLPPFAGVHFSNELPDAMPVHRLVFRGGAWRERYVAVSPEEAGEDEAKPAFAWAEGPLSTPELAAFIPFLPAVEGYETEVNLAAPAWVEAVAARLERGYLLAADYGFSRADLYLPERTRGTLSCYRRHRRSDDPLAFPGEQDITAHVDFTTLAERGERAGMRLAGFADQHHFMVGLGRHAFPDATAPLRPEEQRERRAFASLMHPGLMGRGFRFLALAKNAPAALRGFEFAGDPRRALGLE